MHVVGKRIQQYCAECLEITKRTEAGHRSLLTFTQHFSSCLGPCYHMAPHLIATSMQGRYFPVSLGKSQPSCKWQIWISNPDLSDVKALTPASKRLKKLSACPEDSRHGLGTRVREWWKQGRQRKQESPHDQNSPSKILDLGPIDCVSGKRKCHLEDNTDLSNQSVDWEWEEIGMWVGDAFSGRWW